MPLIGEYELSPDGWVRDQTEKIFETGTTESVDINGRPVVLVTMRGAKSGKLRKVPLMRVEHDGDYALVASYGGAPSHPVWYHNLVADPDAVQVQDGPAPFDVTVREVTGDERAAWWDRAVAVFPNYAEYQAKTDRQIPVLIASPR